MRGLVGRRGSIAEFFQIPMDGYWPLDGGSATDYSGNGRHGAISGAFPVGGVLPGDAFYFGSSTQKIDFGNVLGYERTSKFIFLAWIQANADGIARNQEIVSKYGSSRGYSLFVSASTGVARFILSSSASVRAYVSGSTYLLDGNPHCVAVKIDGSSSAAGISMLVDGKGETETVITDNLTTTILNTSSFQIGNNAGVASRGFQGIIDEVAAISKDLELASLADYYRWATQDGPLGRFNRLRRMRR